MKFEKDLNQISTIIQWQILIYYWRQSSTLAKSYFRHVLYCYLFDYITSSFS